MSMINKEISDFSVMAFHKGECRTVTRKDVLGKTNIEGLYAPGDICEKNLRQVLDLIV